MYFVYILQSLRDKRSYVGCTSNLERRLKEHAQGKTKSLCKRRPLTLIHAERFKTKAEAQKREKFFKSGVGREEIRNLLHPPSARL